MSASLEEYLKTIYILIKRKGEARVTDIAEELGYKKPSVNSALKKLKEEGYIDYEPYKDVKLTKIGENEANEIVKKHDTLKAFLIKVLNVEEETAEKEAKMMKHAMSEDSIKKLEKYIQGIIDVEEFVCNYNPTSEKCKKCMNRKFRKDLKGKNIIMKSDRKGNEK